MKLAGLILLCAATVILSMLIAPWKALVIGILYEIGNVLYWRVWKLYETDNNEG
jgi:ABC-type transport system involved in multi-copper enzyme maturation permease subunit